MDKKITLQIATTDEQDRVSFAPLAGVYGTRKQAMTAAKKAAGRGAKYTGDGLSVRYSGPAGTVYVVEA